MLSFILNCDVMLHVIVILHVPVFILALSPSVPSIMSDRYIYILLLVLTTTHCLVSTQLS